MLFNGWPEIRLSAGHAMRSVRDFAGTSRENTSCFYRLKSDGIRIVRILHQQMIPVKAHFEQ
jgi:hypothetical protein